MSKIVKIVGGAALVVVGVLVAAGGDPALGAALISTGASLALGAVLQPKLKTLERLQQQSVMVRSAVKSQEIVYGRDKKSGVVAYFDTSGGQNEFLWFVVAVAEHEVDGYEKLWIDDVAIDIATEIDVDGFVTNTKFVNADGTKLVKTKFYTGLSTQTADAELVAAFADWTIDHKGVGVAYFWARLELDRSDGGNDPENPQANVWDKGAPTELSVTLRGAKVYDPRLDDLNGGTGTHRVDDPTSWAWSENSVLCRTDYLRSVRFGPGYLSTEIIWSVVIANADIADQIVSLPDSGSQKRYTLNGIVNVDETPKSIIESMQSADHGVTLFLASGVEVRVGAWDAVTHTIDATWLAGPITAESAIPTDDAYNAVRGQYMSAVEGYQIIEFQPRLAPAFETEDGVGRVWEEILLPFTREEFAAQRLAIIELKKSRQQVTARLQANFRGEVVQIYETVALNLAGFTGETFRVIGKVASTDGTTSLELREEDAQDWTYDVPDLATPPVIPSVVRFPDGVPAPLGLAAITAAGGIRVVWLHPSMTAISHIEIYAATTNDRSAATLLSRQKGEFWFHELAEGEIRYYWIIARGPNGMLSQWFPLGSTDGVQGTAGAAGTGENAVFGALSNETHITQADSDGTGYDLTGAGGTFHIWDGTADVTGVGPVYSVEGGDTFDGLTMAIDSASGVYSLSGANWTSGALAFTLRAVYGGITLDRVYSIAKATRGVDPKFLEVNASGQFFKYNTDGVLIAPTEIDFTADQAGSTATVMWRTQRWDGVTWTNTSTNRVSPTTGLSTTLTEANFAAENENALRVHAVFEDPSAQFTIDNITVQRLQDGAIGPTGDPGAAGDDGLSVAELLVFRRLASTPSTPTGGSYDFGTQTLTPPTNWSSNVPSGSDPAWASRAVAAVIGQTGVDSSLSWSSPVKMTQDGSSIDIIFKRAATQPTTPSPSSGVPSGWSSDVDSVPTSSDPLWSSVGTRPNAGQLWTWQLPVLVEGQEGGDGITANLTRPSPLIPTDKAGENYPRLSLLGFSDVVEGSNGTFEIKSGAFDVTTSTDFTVMGGAASGSDHFVNQNGAAFVIKRSGSDRGKYVVRATSPKNWTSASEEFTVRATYNGVTYDRFYRIIKASGALQLVQIFNREFDDTNDSGTASILLIFGSDGQQKWKREADTFSNILGDWLLAGANGDYEIQATLSEGTLTSGTVDTWQALSTSRSWKVSTDTANPISARMQMVIRSASDGAILAKERITISASGILS